MDLKFSHIDIWLPKRFGHFSLVILEEKALGAFIEDAFASR
jgi:methylmalonyl-CoA/ethylmalonyl-CoA epimerase